MHVYLFHEQYVKDAGAEIVDATITDKRFKVSDPEDMDSLHAILCVSIPIIMNLMSARSPFQIMLTRARFLLLDCLYEL